MWVMAVALCLAALWAAVFPLGTGPLPVTGPYAVAHALATLTDAYRLETYGSAGGHRRVTVGVWYPSGEPGTQASDHPLVVFSHGALGVLDSNESLYRELASHGYVVASIGHTYQALYVVEDPGGRTWIDAGYLRDLRREDAKVDRRASFELYRQWMAVRTADIEFVIESLIGVTPTASALSEARELVDGTRIGLMGHSLGGSAALGVGRLRAEVTAKVAAVVALESPLLTDIVGVELGEFVIDPSPYPVPVLNVYSDDTWGRLTEMPQYAGNVALLESPHDDVINVHIEGSRHLGLTDLSLTSPLLTRLLGGTRQVADAKEVLRAVSSLTLEFLDTHLRGF